METNEIKGNETVRFDLRGHVFFTRQLNDQFDLIITDDDLIKSALVDLSMYYLDVVDLAYDDEDAELIVNGEDGEEYWGDDADGVTVFFVHKGMLQFRIAPGSGAIGFMVHKDAHANQEKLKEAAEHLKKMGEAETCECCANGTFNTEVNSDAE